MFLGDFALIKRNVDLEFALNGFVEPVLELARTDLGGVDPQTITFPLRVRAEAPKGPVVTLGHVQASLSGLGGVRPIVAHASAKRSSLPTPTDT